MKNYEKIISNLLSFGGMTLYSFDVYSIVRDCEIQLSEV